MPFFIPSSFLVLCLVSGIKGWGFRMRENGSKCGLNKIFSLFLLILFWLGSRLGFFTVTAFVVGGKIRPCLICLKFLRLVDRYTGRPAVFLSLCYEMLSNFEVFPRSWNVDLKNKMGCKSQEFRCAQVGTG